MIDMKLQGHLITSLECLHTNFSFSEAWEKRRILVRDLSPEHIHYYSKEKMLIYEALRNPAGSRIENGKIIFADGKKLEIQISDEVTRYLKLFKTMEERICAITLSLLADRPLSLDEIKKISNRNNLHTAHIILRNGDELCLTSIKPGGSRLIVKRISVPGTETNCCQVGNVSLEPGEVTFGVFQDSSLVDVSPNKISSNKYDLQYVLEGDCVKLDVYSLDREKRLNSYRDVTYICLIGDDAFVRVQNRHVYCYNNNDLNTRLRSKVVAALNPLIAHADDNLLRIIYEDTTEIRININI